MTNTNSYPDYITPPVLAGIERSVSEEIATTTVTTAYLDGSARRRRDLRILARRLNGIAAIHGVTLEQAIAQAQQEDRPIVVALDIADMVVPVAVDTTEEAPAVTAADNTTPDVPVAVTPAASAPASVSPVAGQGTGKTRRTRRAARRAASRAAANLGQVA